MKSPAERLYLSAEKSRAACEYKKAAAQYRKALKTRGNSIPGLRRDILSGLGGALRMEGKFKQAALAYRKAVKISEKAGDAAGKADALCGLAMARKGMDDFAGALVYLEKARSIYMETNDKAGLGYVCWAKGVYRVSLL